MPTYDIHFDIETEVTTNSKEKGMDLTFGEAKGWLRVFNGSSRELFQRFQGGIVSIVSNQTRESRYMEYVR